MAWDIIEKTSANLFLTGKAGTGKTTFLKRLREVSPKRMVVLAPTGIAAINAGGVTIHSFFQLPLSPYVPGASYSNAENKYFRFSKQKRNIIRTMDLLVIDEISMVRADLLDAVDSVMRRYRDHFKPFGGVQLLMIGDLQQLAPVIKEEEWGMLSQYYDTPYFFSSNALNQAKYHTIELKNVYRQQDQHFISLLNQIRENKATDETLHELNKRYDPTFTPSADSDYIRLTTHNYPAQQINEYELSLLPSKEYTFKAEVSGTFPETSYPADELLVLKQGAQIMFIKNDSEKRFFNGMIGEVVYVNDNLIKVRGKNGGEIFELERSEWTNSKYTIDEVSKEIKETVEGVFSQYPIRLAWAITIHKSQGLTFEHAIIDVSRSFAHGQTYVALSRCKSLEGMVLSAPLNYRSIISDATLDSYTDKIETMVPTSETVAALQYAFNIQVLDELFDFTSLQESFNLLLRTIDEHLYRRYPKLLAEYKKEGQIFSSLAEVSQKFKKQYQRLLDETHDISASPIQERIHKAAEYFRDNLVALSILCSKTKVDIDNKVVKKQFDERFSVFNEELLLKGRLLNYESGDDTKFSTGDYLKAKATILLGIDPEEEKKSSKRKKKEKAPKPPKVNTKEVSLGMFKEGKSISEIATERNLTEGTIFNHLACYLDSGEVMLDNLVSCENVAIIKGYINRHRDASVTDIKNALGRAVTFNEVRLILQLSSEGKI
ncbi:MAG: helix-turn-helix domain-containing protein [Prevotellaceae bacterium]|nr:helix-turn-helix domain-containing protein [Prevotellaceae bacterium]